jgi:hypothetical protein
MANRRLIAGIFLAAMLAVPAAAQDIRGEIEAALVAQGYEIVQVGRTWLGRLRVVAQNDEIRREIVINPTTGEVLRDYSVSLANLGKPLFPDDDHNDEDRSAAAPLATAGGVASDGTVAAGSVGGEPEAAAAQGAAGAVESPPLAVDD